MHGEASSLVGLVSCKLLWWEQVHGPANLVSMTSTTTTEILWNTMGVVHMWELRNFLARAAEVQGTVRMYTLARTLLHKFYILNLNIHRRRIAIAVGIWLQWTVAENMESEVSTLYKKYITSFVFLLYSFVSSEVITFTRRILDIGRSTWMR